MLMNMDDMEFAASILDNWDWNFDGGGNLGGNVGGGYRFGEDIDFAMSTYSGMDL